MTVDTLLGVLVLGTLAVALFSALRQFFDSPGRADLSALFRPARRSGTCAKCGRASDDLRQEETGRYVFESLSPTRRTE
ncbi:MAG TPA: hypothetical protein VF170_01005 [Planctomycetaceae bacterium]